MQQPLVSVIIPAKDEADNLPHLLDEIAASLADVEHEVLVVDDGSTDTTWTLLTQRAARDHRLRPLHHARSVGQSTSIWQAAHQARGTWLATLDGDGQNDPADLPRLLDKARHEDVAMVAGHRVSRRDDWLKRVSSRVANRIRSALLKDDTPDTGCGLKVIRRDAFVTLPYFDHMHRFLPALIQSQGGRCVSVPVNHRPRQAGRSHYGLNNRLWAGLIDMVGVMWLRRRSRLPATLSAQRNNQASPDLSPSQHAKERG
ncbi:glycosyltransferase family 2 protein [Modicisalibacter luteus]|uniref:Glycosyltransferase family 2 protein n=1 Tax=Modicisalibacter luteus TaxID=453962 RepID=A0ABV7M3Q1_9GAMM|nr:glycosyltransferase family 2 protein [Halomonas lutea]GHB09782.1 dolichol-phosphate mannosyltransferase [Halomonas lutea]